MRSSLLLQSGGDARLIDRWRRFRVLELLFLLQVVVDLPASWGTARFNCLDDGGGGGVVFECSSSCVVCRGRVRSLVLRHRHEREKETETEREFERENKKKKGPHAIQSDDIGPSLARSQSIIDAHPSHRRADWGTETETGGRHSGHDKRLAFLETGIRGGPSFQHSQWGASTFRK